MTTLLLAIALGISLLAIPLGLSGTWLMVLAAFVADRTGEVHIGAVTLVGAIVGVPVPILGSVLGALAGSFVGALAFEGWGGVSQDVATRAATGAVIARAIAMASKAAAGCVIAAWVLGAALL